MKSTRKRPKRRKPLAPDWCQGCGEEIEIFTDCHYCGRKFDIDDIPGHRDGSVGVQTESK